MWNVRDRNKLHGAFIHLGQATSPWLTGTMQKYGLSTAGAFGFYREVRNQDFL
jgi:hypothetical protein